MRCMSLNELHLLTDKTTCRTTDVLTIHPSIHHLSGCFGIRLSKVFPYTMGNIPTQHFSSLTKQGLSQALIFPFEVTRQIPRTPLRLKALYPPSLNSCHTWVFASTKAKPAANLQKFSFFLQPGDFPHQPCSPMAPHVGAMTSMVSIIQLYTTTPESHLCNELKTENDSYSTQNDKRMNKIKPTIINKTKAIE